jgi:Ni/Co efflux regulator RcnB
MNKLTFGAVLTALALGIGNVAVAQPRGDNDRGRGHDVRDRSGPPNRGGHDDRRGDRRGDRHVDRGRGAGPEHSFYRGGRLPTQWRSRQYVVSDWRGHHLSAPPRGHQWVQVGGDYVLVAIATGVIASILLNQ